MATVQVDSGTHLNEGAVKLYEPGLMPVPSCAHWRCEDGVRRRVTAWTAEEWESLPPERRPYPVVPLVNGIRLKMESVDEAT